ncbi:MAG: moderate conductance mechanosensitive channel [Acetobacteraceae bacterium]|nr:moderate conductance mechanosensitive channel [Acetobacteraceae bacterium]
MIRLLLVIFSAVILGVPAPSGAQKAASPASPPPAISADQAHAALDVLNDPAKRAAFAATLNAIIKAQPGPAATIAATSPPPAAPAATTLPAAAPAETTVQGLTIPLAPDSLGAQVLLSASAFVNRIGSQTVNAMEAVQSLPLLYGWAFVMATNPIARGVLVDVAWRVILVLACAAAVEYGLRRAMRRPIRGLEGAAPTARAGEAPLLTEDPVARAEAGEVEAPLHRRPRPTAWTLLKRVPLVLARLVLELVPVLGIVLIGHLIAGSTLGGQTISQLIILAIVDAYAVCTAFLCLARMLLSPEEGRLRLFHLTDATAAYLMRWTRRLIVIAVFGYAVGEVGLLLGLSDLAHDAMQKAIGLVLHLGLIYVVIRNRRSVRHWLRAPQGATGAVAALRNRFARIWHWVALFFLVAGWLVWAVEVPHGYAAVLHYFIITSLVLIGARLVLILLLGVVDRFMRPVPDASGLYPGIHARLHIYHPAVTIALRSAIFGLAILGLLQLYGLNTFIWLVSSALGLRILSASGTLVVTILLALGAWEAINGGIQQHLDRLQRDAQLAKSARLRTLLPLLRTTLLITIAIFAGLTILSEIGINIAPLLAGAGIIGVAIGFGSQKLVQDLITGIFLLLENAMQVGDSVTVSGLSGVVEALSVRTIRLRASDGSVHIIPFSSVTSVTNVNRGLGNAAVNVSVAYDEDTDRVADELKAIVADMRTDPDLSAKMLSDLQLWGVDKVDGASVTIAGQVVCTDSGRWAVQREFNRRMKRRFQELGIRIFNPVQTITLSGAVQAPVEQGDAHGHAQAAN